MGKFSIKVIGGGVFLKNKPQTITITWEIKDEDGNKVIPDKLWINNIIQDPATTSKTYNRVYSDVDFTVKAIKDDIVAIGITTARFLGPNQTVEDSLNSSSNSIALSANQGKVLNEKIDNASNKFKGLFTTLIDLKKKIRTGEEGDWAIVGESIPANIFRWGDEGWESTGGTYDGTVDLTPYTRETKTIEYTDDYNVSKNHTHVIKVYDVINWATVTYDPTAPVYKFGDSYDEGEVVNMIDDIAFSYKALSSTATAPYLTQESNAYTLEDAITLLPEELATAGQKISFYNIKEESWMTYVFTGGDHKNATFWEVFTNNVDKDINNLQNQITESNNKFNSIDNKFTEVDKEIDNLDDKIDNVDSHILLSSTSIACGGEDIELVADRAYKDSDGNIITDTYVTREGLTNSIIDITNQQVTDLKPGSVDPEDLSEATKQLLGNKFIVNLPDEEDITTKNQSLKLKDKEYSPKDYSGMGRKRLRKHYVNGVNVLTQHMINKPNTIYIIEYDYCLADQTIEVPENCVLDFQGGSLRNGIIVANKTMFINHNLIDVRLSGVYSIDDLPMFEYPDFYNNEFYIDRDYIVDCSDFYPNYVFDFKGKNFRVFSRCDSLKGSFIYRLQYMNSVVFKNATFIGDLKDDYSNIAERYIFLNPPIDIFQCGVVEIDNVKFININSMSLQVSRINNAIIKNVHIYNCNIGFSVGKKTNIKKYTNIPTSVKIIDCSVDCIKDFGSLDINEKYGGIGIYVNLIDNVSIENCRIKNTLDTATKTDGCNNVTYMNCSCSFFGKDGIKIQSVNNTPIRNSHIINCSSTDKFEGRPDGKSGLSILGTWSGSVCGCVSDAKNKDIYVSKNWSDLRIGTLGYGNSRTIKISNNMLLCNSVELYISITGSLLIENNYFGGKGMINFSGKSAIVTNNTFYNKLISISSDVCLLSDNYINSVIEINDLYDVDRTIKSVFVKNNFIECLDDMLLNIRIGFKSVYFDNNYISHKDNTNKYLIRPRKQLNGIVFFNNNTIDSDNDITVISLGSAGQVGGFVAYRNISNFNIVFFQGQWPSKFVYKTDDTIIVENLSYVYKGNIVYTCDGKYLALGGNKYARINDYYFTDIANMKTNENLKDGFIGIDKTTNKVVWWNGTNWVDATGTTV